MAVLYGVCIGNEDRYRSVALEGLERISATGRVLESRDNSSIFPAYNRMLDEAGEQDDLDALVLLHEDLEILDPDFEAKVLAGLEDETAIVGTIGGRGVRGTRWNQARERVGRQPDAEGDNDLERGTHDVDQVDGCLLVLSPWAVRNLRFDEDMFDGFHAYDADICMQARSAGKKVRVVDVETRHHNTPGFGDIATHQRSDDTFRRKWNLPLDSLAWRLPRRYPRTIGRIRRLTRR